jgi:hypothetical protein
MGKRSCFHYKLLYMFFVTSVFTTKAQDSSKANFKLFDISLHAGIQVSEEQSKFGDVSSFAPDAELINESKGYATADYNRFTESPQESYCLGIMASFKSAAFRSRFQKRIKPRVGVYYVKKTLFNYPMSYQDVKGIDTLYYSNPVLPPMIIDSTTGGDLFYSYVSKQVYIELGANVDVYTRRYFNFYSGLLLGGGSSFRNEFVLAKYEYYRIDPYPGQKTGTVGTLKDFTKKETGAQSFLTRITIPIGVQHRFSQKRNFSPGLFGELRPGYEIYKVKNGPSVSRFVFSISCGIRLSLQRHK